MNSACIFTIVVLFLIIRASTKKNKLPGKVPNNPQTQAYEEKPVRGKPVTASRARARKASKGENSMRPVVERAKANNTKDTSDDMDAEIVTRREDAHNEYMKQRIHSSLHESEPKVSEMPADTSGMMEKVRDLIVCGYPTELIGQRDFVKESEDFLAQLSRGTYYF